MGAKDVNDCSECLAFVDFGHSKTTVTIASFIQGKTKIICHKSDRNLGATRGHGLHYLIGLVGEQPVR